MLSHLNCPTCGQSIPTDEDRESTVADQIRTRCIAEGHFIRFDDRIRIETVAALLERSVGTLRNSYAETLDMVDTPGWASIAALARFTVRGKK